MTYPPPEEREELERRLGVLRPWLRAIAAGLGLATLAALGLAIAQALQ